MKKIIKYAAHDGSEFFSKKDCARYEDLCDEINKIIGVLQPLPEDKNCEFVNGAGYIQHNAQTFRKVHINLLKIAYRLTTHNIIKTALENPDSVHSTWISRIISDSGVPKILNIAYSRIMSTDQYFREWGQPYFATHPDEATHFIIKD